MTKLSPLFGWPIAEDIDVVKQYPAAVDEPFKMLLESHLGLVAATGAPRFANAAARDAAIPAPVEGQISWLNDMRQQQTYLAPHGWLPSGGIMPYGYIASGATAQSVPANTDTKLTFAGKAPVLVGGMTWNATENRFIGPPGVYDIFVTMRVLSAAAANTIHGYAGSSTAQGRTAFGHSLAASAISFSATGSTLEGDTRLAGWVNTSVARSVDYAALIVTYRSFPQS